MSGAGEATRSAGARGAALVVPEGRVTVERVLADVQEALAVSVVAVLMPDAGGAHLVVNSARGLEAAIHGGVRIPLSSAFAGRVAATRTPVRLRRADVELADVGDSILWHNDVRSVLGVPLLADRRPGVLYVGSQDDREFGDDEVASLEDFAQHVAAALRSDRGVAERSAARTLQESLLPTQLPEVEGLEFASRFVAAEDFGVGGDWFDVFPLPDGQIGVVIGDVAGSGLRAAVVMGRLRSALRAYAIESASPSEALSRLDRKFAHFEPNEMATILYLTVDLDREHLTVSCTGHPPPVVADVDGAAVLMDCSPSAPIGAHVQSNRVDVRHPLAPGTTVVCYTDGLVERRRESLDVGLERLRRAVYAGPPEDVCSKIMNEVIGAAKVQDDTALLAFRRSP
jgi:sigma-B regulation protein RsbU (phosphoserine phosphatase)